MSPGDIDEGLTDANWEYLLGDSLSLPGILTLLMMESLEDRHLVAIADILVAIGNVEVIRRLLSCEYSSYWDARAQRQLATAIRHQHHLFIQNRSLVELAETVLSRQPVETETP